VRRAVAAAAGRRWRFAGHPPAWPAARASACAPDLGRGVGNSFRSAPAKKSAILLSRGRSLPLPIRQVPVTNENACRRNGHERSHLEKPRGSRFRLEESDTHARARRQASSGSTMAATAPERELLKRFEVQKFLGKGSYGSVYVRASRLGAHLASSIFLDPCWLFMTRVTSRAKTARRDGRRARARGRRDARRVRRRSPHRTPRSPSQPRPVIARAAFRGAFRSRAVASLPRGNNRRLVLSPRSARFFSFRVPPTFDARSPNRAKRRRRVLRSPTRH
jgi:hypothetical protein